MNNANKDYELLNLEMEYPGLEGGVKWAIITDLPMNVLISQYGKEVERYRPFVLMSKVQGQTIQDYHRNEKKFKARAIRHHDVRNYEDEAFNNATVTNIGTAVKTILEEDGIVDHMLVKWAFDKLSDKQRKRCYLYYFFDMTEAEIAMLEGVSQQAIHDSLRCAYKLMKLVIEG